MIIFSETPSWWQKLSAFAFGGTHNNEAKNELGSENIQEFEDINEQPLNKPDDEEPIKLETNNQSENNSENLQSIDIIEINHQKSQNIEDDGIQILGILAADDRPQLNKMLVDELFSKSELEPDTEKKHEHNYLAGYPYEETCREKPNTSVKNINEFDLNYCNFCLKEKGPVSSSENLARGENIPELVNTVLNQTSDDSANAESNYTYIGETFSTRLSSHHSDEDIVSNLLPSQFCIQSDEKNQFEDCIEFETASDSFKTDNFLEDALKSLEEMYGFSDIDIDCLSKDLIKELLAETKREDLPSQDVMDECTLMTADSK